MKNSEINKYPKYKPSGIEWMGEIPSDWKLERTKWIYSESRERNRELNYNEEDLLSVSEYYGVAKRNEKIDNNDLLNRAESLSENMKVRKGELVINIMLAWKKGLGTSNYEGIVSPSYCVYRLINGGYHPKYFHYLYRTDEYAETFRRFSRGIIDSRLRLYSEEFFNTLTLIPPPAEQTAIANYLDDKTEKIDTLIEKKKKLIELYKEERIAVINQAVTRGINPNVKLKPSGIDWLGDIPEHWEVKKLKYVGNIKYGLGQPPRQLDTGLPLIRATNIERGRINEKDLIFVDPDDVPFDRDPVLKENDIIIVRSGAYTADSAIIPKKYEGAITGYDMVFRVYNDNPFFISYILLSNYLLVNQLYLQRLRAAQPHLNKEELGEAFLLMPKKIEQDQVVQYIETETKRIDDTITKIGKEIELLSEYRTALISEVVTGKIKV